jgi:hypothetical protein
MKTALLISLGLGAAACLLVYWVYKYAENPNDDLFPWEERGGRVARY